jgi:hypothetical protein
MRIEELLARRGDLSTFLVHLTRGSDGVSAKDRLKGILQDFTLKAGAPMGQAVKRLERAHQNTDSQKVVCFTETPLEHVSLLLGEIEGRRCQFEPYGLAITKKQGRARSVNPVWYVDITPGHDWLTQPLDELVNQAVLNPPFDEHPIAKLAPFFEQMGSGGRADGGGYRKEFWWEREWRHVGDRRLPRRFLLFCPEDEIEEFETEVGNIDQTGVRVRILDPKWSLEVTIAKLANFDDDDIGPF